MHRKNLFECFPEDAGKEGNFGKDSIRFFPPP